MNIELDEVVQAVTDDALELAAGQGGYPPTVWMQGVFAC